MGREREREKERKEERERERERITLLLQLSEVAMVATVDGHNSVADFFFDVHHNSQV